MADQFKKIPASYKEKVIRAAVAALQPHVPMNIKVEHFVPNPIEKENLDCYFYYERTFPDGTTTGIKIGKSYGDFGFDTDQGIWAGHQHGWASRGGHKVGAAIADHVPSTLSLSEENKAILRIACDLSMDIEYVKRP